MCKIVSVAELSVRMMARDGNSENVLWNLTTGTILVTCYICMEFM
jgi:hypothetical protein